jgi:radical SAM protein with 4Fe4S-binding SPASM domain
MKKIKFLDPSIERKKNITDNSFQLLRGTPFPLPSEVEISESGTCNRTCSFCPRSDPNFKDVKDFIKSDLHTKLINELKEQDYKGVVRYSGFVEPLLDKNIYNLILQTKSNLPNARVEMVTNGDVLNINRLNMLFKSGLDTILISVYDGPEDAKMFEDMCIEARLNVDQYVIRHRYFNEEKDFGLTISNRAGMMKNAEYKIMPLKKELKAKCFYPGYTFFMDYNGDVLMCPHDWGKKIILGNLNHKTFKEIWTSKKAINLRKKLNEGNRKFAPCNVCDVNGELIGKKHAEVWDTI